MVSKVVNDWLEREKIDVKHVLDKTNDKLLSSDKYNPIVTEFGVFYEPNTEEVSIGDIIGFENDGQTFFRGRGENVFEELIYLYSDDLENEYKTRANGILMYSKEEVLSKLSESFKTDPLRVKEVDFGKYSIDGNGKHRFTILKAIYLSELAEIDPNDQDKLDALKKKYTIPVTLARMDVDKTYTNFFMSSFGIYDVNTKSYDPNTGFMSVEWKDELFFIGSIESQIKLAKRIVTENANIFNEPYKGKRKPGEICDRKHLRFIQLKRIIDSMPNFYRTLSSFRKYVNENMKDCLLNIKVNDKSTKYPDFDD